MKIREYRQPPERAQSYITKIRGVKRLSGHYTASMHPILVTGLITVFYATLRYRRTVGCIHLDWGFHAL